MRRIYLDNNSTTPIAAQVREAMAPFLAEYYGNPSSMHGMGRICSEAIEDARGHVAAAIGAEREQIVFTSGATESNNMALKGVLLREAPSLDGHLIVSALEHPAISRPAEYLVRLGVAVTEVGCDPHGRVDPEEVRRAIRSDTRLVSIMHANNEIGTVQPIREIASICREHNVLVHTDAAQSLGKIPVNACDLGVDLLSIAGHKFHAPKGIGALFVGDQVSLEPLMHGAGHEQGMRAGTENVPGIVALGAAALLAARGLETNGARMLFLRDRLLDQLSAAIGPSLSVNGAHGPRLPNTLSVNFPNVVGRHLLARVPEVCASTGAACHSTGTTLSKTLSAIGLHPAIGEGTVRLSLGWHTSEEDVDRAASLLIGAWESLTR
ncbi:MAG: cysteine desulfurase family protein [Planctomycetota bacterium]